MTCPVNDLTLIPAKSRFAATLQLPDVAHNNFLMLDSFRT